MVATRMNIAGLAGIDNAITQIRREHSRVLERTACFIDDCEFVRINEVRNGYGKLLFAGPVQNAVLFLSAYQDFLEDE